MKPKLWVLDEKPNLSEEVKAQLASLKLENQALQAKLEALANEVQSLKNTIAHYTPAQPPGQVESQAEAPSPGQAQSQSQGEGQGLSLAELEAKLRQDLAWLDEPCPFKKAIGRSWRQMSQNEGEKIPMNGKGPHVPRAYLHSIESWAEAGQVVRLKAKLALALGKGEGQ